MNKLIACLAFLSLLLSCSCKHDKKDGIYYIITNNAPPDGREHLDPDDPPPPPMPSPMLYFDHNFILYDNATVYYHHYKRHGWLCGDVSSLQKPERLFLTPDSLIEIKVNDLHGFLENKFGSLDSAALEHCTIMISSPTDTIRNKAFKIIEDYLFANHIPRYMACHWKEEEQYVSMAKAQHKDYNPDLIDWKVGFDADDENLPEKLPVLFKNLLNRAGMSFIPPDGMVETAIIPNNQMNYEYALKFPDKEFEVRYAIRPLDIQMKEYHKKEENISPGDVNIDPNSLHPMLLKATILNISGGKAQNFTVFNQNAVKQEFNADWGATAFFEVGKEFGQHYKYCMVVAIHKDYSGDAYFFYLSDSKDDFDKLTEPAFHSLKF